MSYQVTYVLGSNSRTDRALQLGKVLKGLTRIDCDWLRAHPEAPRSAASRVKLVPEPQDVDTWRDVPSMIRTGWATAPEFRCWQAAEAKVRDGKPLTVPVLDTIDDEQGRFVVAVDLFKGESERHLSHRALSHMLVALAESDALLLRRHPEWPDLYDAGVRYQEEPPGEEDWLDVPSAIAVGNSGGPVDCEDLACWRAAELNVRYNIKARPSFLWRRRPNGSYLYHIQVTYPDGRIEDPSRRLGMR